MAKLFQGQIVGFVTLCLQIYSIQLWAFIFQS
jgi:hypothetical protein